MKENVPPSIDFAKLASSILDNVNIFVIFIIAFILVLAFYPRYVKKLFAAGGPISVLELQLNRILLALDTEKDIINEKIKLANLLHEQNNMSKVKFFLRSRNCFSIARNLVGLSGIAIVTTSSLLISIILYLLSATNDNYLMEFLIGAIPMIVSSFIAILIKMQYKEINDSLKEFVADEQ